MIQLIEMMGNRSIVNGIPIDLSKLVHGGSELISVSIYDTVQPIDVAKRMAEGYGCQYVMLGKQGVLLLGDGGPNCRIYIASFYRDREK